jgi:sec-independent protein translocase protein TatC
MTVEAPRRPQYREPDQKYMTFVEHLQELRVRLFVSILAIAIGSVAGWFLAPQVIHLIDIPVCSHFKGDCKLYVDNVTGAFTLTLKVAIIIGFIFALPVTVWQSWAFVAPAFGRGANRWAPLWMLSALVLFAGGALTGYFIIPLALGFLTQFQTANIRTLVFASNYIGFVMVILVVFGLSFELPLVLVSLTSVGITSSRWLASKRVYAFFAIFLFSTVVTPGADLVSPLILGGILYVLFEVSILVSRLLGK